MDTSIRQILDPRVLTAAYAQMPGALPTPLTDAWFIQPEDVDGDTVRSMYDPADATPAPANLAGAEARVIALGDARERVFNLFFSFNKTAFGEDVLNALREPDSYTLQRMGRTEVTRVMNKFAGRMRRFKELVIAKVLTQGVVYLNAAGTVLESSAGATVTATFDVDATHQGNLNGLVSGLFSNTSTDIASIIEAIDDAAEAANVPAPTDVWVNKLNLRSLRNNTSFSDWARYNPQVSLQVLQGGVLDNLWGKTWHFVGTRYRAADGTMKPYVPLTGTGSAVFTPPPGEAWVKCSQGSTVLPRSMGVFHDVEEALGNLDLVYGAFSYAKLLDDPVRLMGYFGDKFGFNFNEPNAVWQAAAF